MFYNFVLLYFVVLPLFDQKVTPGELAAGDLQVQLQVVSEEVTEVLQGAEHLALSVPAVVESSILQSSLGPPVAVGLVGQRMAGQEGAGHGQEYLIVGCHILSASYTANVIAKEKRKLSDKRQNFFLSIV